MVICDITHCSVFQVRSVDWHMFLWSTLSREWSGLRTVWYFLRLAAGSYLLSVVFLFNAGTSSVKKLVTAVPKD